MSAIVSIGDVKMPDTLEGGVGEATRGGGAKKSVGGAIVVSGYHYGENGVVYSEDGSDIEIVLPTRALIPRMRGMGMAISTDPTEVGCIGNLARGLSNIVLASGDRWVLSASAVRYCI